MEILDGKSTMAALKDLIGHFNSRLNQAEERISELKVRSVETDQNNTNKKSEKEWRKPAWSMGYY